MHLWVCVCVCVCVCLCIRKATYLMPRSLNEFMTNFGYKDKVSGRTFQLMLISFIGEGINHLHLFSSQVHTSAHSNLIIWSGLIKFFG